MARIQTLSGETVTITEVKSTDAHNRHWWMVSGTAQGVIDYLEENRIGKNNISHLSFVSSVWYCWFYKN